MVPRFAHQTLKSHKEKPSQTIDEHRMTCRQHLSHTAGLKMSGNISVPVHEKCLLKRAPAQVAACPSVTSTHVHL